VHERHLDLPAVEGFEVADGDGAELGWNIEQGPGVGHCERSDWLLRMEGHYSRHHARPRRGGKDAEMIHALILSALAGAVSVCRGQSIPGRITAVIVVQPLH
jgi:hypothetical protein